MKGFFGDVMTIIVLIFGLAVFLIIMLYAANAMRNTGIPQIDSSMSNVYGGIQSMNSMAPLFVVAAGIGLMLSAFFVRSYPVLFFFFFITQVIAVVVSFPLANAYMSLASDPNLAGIAPDMNLWGLIFQAYPIITTVLGIIFAIAVFAFGGNE